MSLTMEVLISRPRVCAGDAPPARGVGDPASASLCCGATSRKESPQRSLKESQMSWSESENRDMLFRYPHVCC